MLYTQLFDYRWYFIIITFAFVSRKLVIKHTLLVLKLSFSIDIFASNSVRCFFFTEKMTWAKRYYGCLAKQNLDTSYHCSRNLNGYEEFCSNQKCKAFR